MLTLFGMPTRDYRRFMNFLAAHDCGVAFREFRGEAASAPRPVPAAIQPLSAVRADSTEPAVA
jgi:predicted alpha/beta hydrolase